MKTILKITAGIILAVVLLGVGCTALLGSAVDESKNDIKQQKAAEAADVADEITCRANDIGWGEAAGRVTNSSSTQSSYFVTVTFTGPDRVQYAEGVATVTDLAPGATAEWTAGATEDWRDGTTCKVTSIERLAS